ncbi:GntR family transcriptional regulator [Castellaniella sp. S9]|uniref:GntR family transcriptional regulator n=1 Tax=Castellaniella sp. S9 TaxID=2993652 RepID=UPI0022B390BA|nr:GntR family transcriptional regulator [Castellaniella sp. S9]
MARTLAESIASKIREQIICGALEPGQALVQEAIANELNTSRVPVRDALHILAAEGLVQIKSNKGATVIEFSIDDLKQILSIIRALEALATSEGVTKLSLADLNQMESLLIKMESQTDSIREWNILNDRFHSAGTLSAYGTRIHRLIDKHRLLVSRYFHDPVLFRQEVAVWNVQHREIYEACRAGNVEKAKALADLHWEHSTAALLKHLQQQ